MMRSIIGSSLAFRFLVIVVAGVLMFTGINQVRTMPVDVLPEFSPPYVNIQTEALGLSAEEVEQLITVPMEQDLFNGIPWLDVIRSNSTDGLSSIDLFFEPGTDLYRARQMVTERLSQAFALPHVSKTPTMIQPTSSTSRFMIIGLSSKQLSLIDMSIQARWTIGPRLLGVPGVANVAIWGNRDRQLQVQVDPQRLRVQGVPMLNVLETTGNALWVSSLSFVEASTPGTGGFLDTPQQRLGIMHISPILSAEDLAQVPIEGRAGLRLSDVADVVEDHQPLIGDAIVDDQPSLLIVVEKFPGANTLEVTKGVEDALAALQPGMPGIKFDTSIYRPATFIEMAMSNLSKALLLSALLVVIALFLWDWRKGLVSLVVIPLSLVIALWVLYAREVTANALVLAGLMVALAVIIDDVIVDVDNIGRRLRQHFETGVDRPIFSVILEASLEVRSPLFLATLILLLILLLVFFLGGLSGSFFQPLALSYALAVLASLSVALSITPALSMILFSNPRFERRESPLVERLQRGYTRVITQVLQTPRRVYLALGAFVVIGLVALPFLRGIQMIPSFQEPSITIQLEGAPGISRLEIDRSVARISRELRAIPGVRNVGAHVGRAVFGDQVVGINSAELWVSIDPEANHDAALAAIRETVNGYPGIRSNLQTYLTQASSGVIQNSDHSLLVRVYGQDWDILRAQAEKVQQTLTGINGIIDPKVRSPVEEPSLEIKVDIAAAQQYGIKPGDVRRAAAVMISGLQVGSLFEQQKVFDVVVWSTPETRQSLTDIRNLLIDTPSGGHVRLGDVAEVSIRPVPTIIEHEAVSRYLDVTATVSGRSPASAASEVKRALQTLSFPLEYHAEVLGKFAQQQAAQEQILAAVLMALFGIFLLLQASTRNWRLAGALFITLPLTLVGGLLAGFLNGGLFSLGTLMGLLAILGLATRNSILTIGHYQRLETQEGETFGSDLVLRGSWERVSATVISSVTTGLALLPFVMFGKIPGLEILHPMAIVILGGLVTATFFSLFALPAFYLRYGNSREAELGLVPLSAAEIPSGAQD